MTDPIFVPKVTPYQSLPDVTVSTGNRNVMQFNYQFPDANTGGLEILSVILVDTVSGGEIVALNFLSGVGRSAEQQSYVSGIQTDHLGGNDYSFSPRTVLAGIEQSLISDQKQHTMWLNFDFPNNRVYYGIDNKIGTNAQVSAIPSLKSSYIVYIQAGYLNEKSWGGIVDYMDGFAYWPNDQPDSIFIYWYGGSRFKYNHKHHGHHEYTDYGNSHILTFDGVGEISNTLFANETQMTCLGQTTSNPNVLQCQTTWNNWCQQFPSDPRCDCLNAPSSQEYGTEIQEISAALPELPWQCWLPPCIKAGNFTDVDHKTECPTSISICAQIIEAANSNQNITNTTQYQYCCNQSGNCTKPPSPGPSPPGPSPPGPPGPKPSEKNIFLILGLFLLLIAVIVVIGKSRHKHHLEQQYRQRYQPVTPTTLVKKK